MFTGTAAVWLVRAQVYLVTDILSGGVGVGGDKTLFEYQAFW